MDRTEEEAKAHYLAAGMSSKDYETFEWVVALATALRDAGFDELAMPIERLVQLVDRMVVRIEELTPASEG